MSWSVYVCGEHLRGRYRLWWRKPRNQHVWFSCAIDGAEGDEDLTGHAVGWTSGETAWLVVAKDKAAAASLVDALGGVLE